MGFAKILGQLGLAKADQAVEQQAAQPERSALFQDFVEVYSQQGNDADTCMRSAGRLMASHYYDDCLEAYRLLQQRFPERRCVCELKTGATYVLMGEYESAFRYFLAAKVHGADEEESERRIWDACTGILSKAVSNRQKAECVDLYLRLFPQGAHVAEAREMLTLA